MDWGDCGAFIESSSVESIVCISLSPWLCCLGVLPFMEIGELVLKRSWSLKKPGTDSPEIILADLELLSIGVALLETRNVGDVLFS